MLVKWVFQQAVRCWESGAMSSNGLLQVVQDAALLQTQRPDYRPQPLDEPTDRFTVTTKQTLPPQHRRTHRTLRRVVGRFHARHPHKGPQRLLHRQDFPADPGGLGAVAATAPP